MTLLGVYPGRFGIITTVLGTGDLTQFNARIRSKHKNNQLSFSPKTVSEPSHQTSPINLNVGEKLGVPKNRLLRLT